MSTGAKYVAAASDEPSDEPIVSVKTIDWKLTCDQRMDDQRWMIMLISAIARENVDQRWMINAIARENVDQRWMINARDDIG